MKRALLIGVAAATLVTGLVGCSNGDEDVAYELCLQRAADQVDAEGGIGVVWDRIDENRAVQECNRRYGR